MRDAQKSKMRNFASAMMFLAALTMAVPTQAFAAAAEDANQAEAQEQVATPQAQPAEQQTADQAQPETKAADQASDKAAEQTEVKDETTKLEKDAIEDQTQRCTGIYFGSQTTENGDTFIGRSEDLNGNNRKEFNYVQPAKHDNEYYVAIDGETSFKWKMPEETLGYTACHDDPTAWDFVQGKDLGFGADDTSWYQQVKDKDGKDVWEKLPYSYLFAANGINDAGVAITATTTTYMKQSVAELDPLACYESVSEFKDQGGVTKAGIKVTSGGLAESVLGDLLLGNAKSPKEACELAGKIIDQVGAGEGYQFYAGNDKETWMFSTLSGHQWVAFKMPNDKLMVNPNIGGLQYKLDFSDTENVIHSADMQSFAKKYGFAQYYEDGTFNPFASYGNYTGGTGNNGSVNSRLWMGYRYLTGSSVKASAMMKEHPLLFDNEGAKFSTFDILRMLGYQGQGTHLDATAKGTITWKPSDQKLIRAKYGENADGQGLYPIGNLNQLQCHVFQVRKDQSIPAALRMIQWECMGSASYGIFLPTYAGLLTKTSQFYDSGSNAHAGQGAQDPNAVAANSMYWTMTDFSKLVAACVNKGADMSAINEYRDALQQNLIEQQQQFEKAMMKLDPSKWTTASNAIVRTLTDELHSRTVALNDQLRAYYEAGDFTKPFTFEYTGPLTANKVLLDENGEFILAAIGNAPERHLTYDATATDADQPAVNPGTPEVNPSNPGGTTDNGGSTVAGSESGKTTAAPKHMAKAAASATPKTSDVVAFAAPIAAALSGIGALVLGRRKQDF